MIVAYNFQRQFADDVESGKKRQTIRAIGKRKHAKPGDDLQLYTGQRTKACRKLRDAVCVGSIRVMIHEDGFRFDGRRIWRYPPLLEKIAKRDGFESWPAMREWFEKTHGLPFKGVLIMW